MKLRAFHTISTTVAVLFLGFTSQTLSHDEPGGRPHHILAPANPTAVMKAFTAGKLEDTLSVQNLTAMGATPCVGGMAGVYPCSNVDLMSFMPLAEIGSAQSNDEANDIWGWSDSQTGKEYALVGRVFGTSFVDISDPENPIFLGELLTHGRFGSPWRDIKVYNDHAFIVSEARRHGMQVFDLAQLRTVTNPPVQFQETAHYKGFGSAHNVVINEDSGFAYGVGTDQCSGGLAMVDIRDPSKPSNAGCYAADGYTHDAQCVIYDGPDSQYSGHEICFNSNEDTVTIVDVTTKSNPLQISRTGYNGSGYTHQGWLTDDHTYFLMDDELDEQNLGHNTRTRVWDVSDLDAPALLGYSDSSTPAIDHNLYIRGNLAYQANYRAGLRILDISDAFNSGSLSEVAYFDIYPADDSPQFNAAWSNYPFFDSGIVVVSGIEQGLFVVKPNLGPVDRAPTVTITEPADAATVSGQLVVTADATDDNGVTQVEFFIDGNSIGVVDTSAPYEAAWDTSTVADGEHVVSATATDTIGQTGSTSKNVTVDNVLDPTMHAGDLDGGSALGGRGGKWEATVTITVHDASENPVSNATVSGSWTSGATGADSCVTNASGLCNVLKADIKRNSSSVTFEVDSVAGVGYLYDAGSNHDPDGDSNGTTIVVLKP